MTEGFSPPADRASDRAVVPLPSLPSLPPIPPSPRPTGPRSQGDTSQISSVLTPASCIGPHGLKSRS